MKSSSSFSYPAEYYYPEFIDSRPEDPRKSPVNIVPVAASIDNGKGTTVGTKRTNLRHKPSSIQKKSTDRQKPPANVSLDIVTDQGLPGADITEKALAADPKRSLLRDPAEKNIPRLIVDDNIIKQAVRSTKFVVTDLDDNADGTAGYSRGTNRRFSVANGYANGDLEHKTRPLGTPRQQQVVVIDHEQQPMDEYWKQEVHVNDDGVVTIEPLKYDRNTYDGPFGLSRQATVVYYVTLAVITILGAIFLIMTGIFYSQNYPSQSSNAGTLVGVGVCALAFYLSLQLFLIGLWHQKYRRENPKRIIGKPSQHNDSSANLKTSMEENEAYNYSYEQPVDYTAYGDYSSGPYSVYSNGGGYVANPNDQMVLQDPAAATGSAYYDPGAWPSNVEVESQPDPRFLQPMDYNYGQQQPGVDSSSAVLGYTPPTEETPYNSTNTNATAAQSERKSRRHRHHSRKTVQAEPPKPTFDSLTTTSSGVFEPLPVLSKAPETNELLRSIAESEKSNHGKQSDHEGETSSLNENHHRRHSRHRHHSRRRHHSRHRRHSCSSCSTCSSCSYNAYHSDLGANNHHHHHAPQHAEPPVRIITPRQYRTRPISPPSPPRTHSHTYQDTSYHTASHRRKMRDTSTGGDLEDVPNVRDNRLEPIPVVRRTIIVEPYPAEPTAQVVLKSDANTNGNHRALKSSHPTDGGSGGKTNTTTTTTSLAPKRSRKRNKADDGVEDVKLDDVHNENERGNNQTKSSRKSGASSPKKNVKNAFYD